LRATQFDTIASGFAPGFDSLRYRWAALSLRKQRLLKPEHIGRALRHKQIIFGRVEEVDATQIPPQQGIYILYSTTETLYVGEADNLRFRIKKHLDHSDRKGLARWLWEHGANDVRLEIRLLADTTSTRQRRALEAELILSRKPQFNILRP
jgi:predicted GIY-YIG superfamily endonuclease